MTKANLLLRAVVPVAMVLVWGCSGSLDVDAPRAAEKERSGGISSLNSAGVSGGDSVSCEEYESSNEVRVDTSRWRNVVDFEPTQRAKERMQNRDQGKVVEVQEIEGGKGRAELDFYPVRIHGMTGGEVRAFMQHFRTHINDFVPQKWNTVSNYKPIDEQRWQDVRRNTPAPIGAVMIHRVKFAQLKEVVVSKLPTAVTDLLPYGGWVFSTVAVDFLSGGQHAVAGNREFAVRPTEQDGEFIFYTKGAARPYSHKAKHLPVPNRKMLSTGAHEMWTGMMQNVESYLDDKSGVRADALEGEVVRVACPWDETNSEGSSDGFDKAKDGPIPVAP